MCPSRMAGDFLNLSLTWSKSVENAGYEDSVFVFKNHVKVGKEPCTFVQGGPNFQNWVNKPWWWFRGAGLLALELPVLDGEQGKA